MTIPDDKLTVLETLPPDQWLPHLEGIGTAELLAGAVAVVRSQLPRWIEGRPKDRRPVMAVEAAEEWLRRPVANLAAHAALLAKECTKARAASLGYEHRIAEAARALAAAAAAKSEDQRRAYAAEAIARAEEDVLYVFSIKAVYGKECEVRRRLLGVLNDSLSGRAQTPTP